MQGGDRKQKGDRDRSTSSAQKRSRHESNTDGPWWDSHNEYRAVRMAAGQEILFMGQATLEVLEGTVLVDGKQLEVGSPLAKLSTAGRSGLAITIRAQQPGPQRVPLLGSSQVQLCLRAPPPAGLGSETGEGSSGQLHRGDDGGRVSSHAAASSSSAGASGAGRGGRAAVSSENFTLHLPGDLGAPLALQVPHDWERAIAEVCQAVEEGMEDNGVAAYKQRRDPRRTPIVIAVCGAKGMGKSSLARLLTHRLLNSCKEVLYLDTDLGQSEFTPPGMVSLVRLPAETPVLGPPCTHMRAPVAAHYVGDTSPQGDPELYVSAVRSLYCWYRQHGATDVSTWGRWPPLVINTHGWIKGIGLDVLAEVLAAVNPTHVLQFRSQSEGKNLPDGLFWLPPGETPPAAAAAPCRILSLQAAPPLSSAASTTVASANGAAGGGAAAEAGGSWGQLQLQRVLKPAECRSLQWHAWARTVAGIDGTWGSYEGEDLWADAARLAVLRPLCVSLDGLSIRFLYAGDLPPSQWGIALNGAVVGLAAEVPEAAAAGRGWGQAGAEVPAAGPLLGLLPPRGVPPPCLGLGLVRAVDMAARLLYVLSPLSLAEMQRVDTLLVGKSDLPTSLLQVSDAAVSPYMALFCMSTEGTASGGARSRTTLERKGLVHKL